MTQKERILARLREGTWLPVVEATKEMFILRLGARIFDLRAEGHNIIERKVEGKSYSEYLLIPPPKIEVATCF
jgi:Helix-turn-helix domain